ncbi:hypothetical protein EC968_003810 [Mortierella alpina]|nr:hypothetical protein EC968_003810 [Mortierella alpina]
MSLTNVQCPFKIPELCSLIASYLAPYDFAQLCLVSKHFSRLFRPFLWSTIVLRGRADYRDRQLPRVEALKRYGHLVRLAKLFSWSNRDVFSECEDDEDPDAILENDDLLLTETLLAQCGSNLTALKVVDYSSDGRIWGAVMDRIHLNRSLEGARLMNGIRKLDLTLTYKTFGSALQPLLTQPSIYPGAAALFAGVKELRLHGTEVILGSVEELAWEEEVCYGSDSETDAEEQSPITFRELATLFPNLHKLTLVNISIDSDTDTDVDLDESEESAKAATQESKVGVTAHLDDYQFHTLNFQGCDISAKHIVQILKRTRSVRSLKIGGCSPTGDTGVLISSLPVLTPLLTEYGQEGIHFSDWSTVLQGLPSLTRLHISTDTLIEDDALGNLARSCSGLEELHLHYCQSLTSRGLHHILRSCKQLRSLKLLMTPVHWDIFGRDPELDCDSTTAVEATIPAAAPFPPSSFVPWACQDTLQELHLNLLDDIPPESIDEARHRLQSLAHLRDLELRCHKFPAAVLMGFEHRHFPNGLPIMLYPALKELSVQNIYPQLTLDSTIQLVRSMPRLTRVNPGTSFDACSLRWLVEHNKCRRYAVFAE